VNDELGDVEALEIDHKTELSQLEQIRAELITEMNNIDNRIID
jgi:uncharacterized protein YbcI